MTYAKELYHWRKENGICVKCGNKKAVNGVACLDCKEEDALRQQRLYAEMSEEEKAQLRAKKRESLRRLRKKRKESGLCYACGKPVYKNYSRCYECYLKTKKYKRERKGYMEQGLCRICGKEVVPGKKHCQEHLEMRRKCMEHALKCKEERKGKEDDKCKNIL